jgi:hypothetical protein
MNKFAFIGALLLACSGEDFGTEEEFGQAEQAYNAPVSPNYQFGTQTGSSRQRCNRTSTSQVCSIPHSRTLNYCVDFPLNDYITDYIHAEMAALPAQIGWSFSQNIVDGECEVASANLQFTLSATGGSLTNNVKDYVNVLFKNTTSLTENELPGEATVIGNVQKHTQCEIRIDQDDILAKGTSTTQDQNGSRHAVKNGLLKCLGIGAYGTGAGGGRATRNLFDPSIGTVFMTGGEVCMLQAYNPANNGNFANAGTCSSD